MFSKTTVSISAKQTLKQANKRTKQSFGQNRVSIKIQESSKVIIFYTKSRFCLKWWILKVKTRF